MRVATELFGARGYADVALTEVARAANVTKGAVYHYFGSKQNLFAVVRDCVEARAVASSTEAVRADAPLLEQVETALLVYVQDTADEAAQRILYVDAPWVLNSEPVGQRNRGTEALAGVLRDAVTSGEAVPFDPDAMATLISGACKFAAAYVASADDPDAARRDVSDTISVLIRSLSRAAVPQPRA